MSFLVQTTKLDTETGLCLLSCPQICHVSCLYIYRNSDMLCSAPFCFQKRWREKKKTILAPVSSLGENSSRIA